MKGRNGSARPHVVPITAEVAAILDELPTFKRGEYVFSTSFGEKPAWVTDRAKKWLEARMQRTLRALARKNGDDPEKVTLEPWVNHDIRRTLRSRMSELRVPTDVAEAVLAHVKPGIVGVYDRHQYLNEKREALELWAARLRSIVQPTPANVVDLKARA
jgi:integrase